MARFISFVYFLLATIAALPAANVAASDFTIHRYVAGPDRWNTNSYWLESNEGLVLIDAQLLIEDAELWAAMLASTQKPVKGLFLTHGHADHMGGLNVLLEKLGPFPVITTKGTADTLKASHKAGSTYAQSVYGARFDSTYIAPTQVIDGKEEIELAGIRFILEDIGPGESANATLVYQPEKKALFSGDATMHHSHLYTGEGHSTAFLKQLRYLQKTYQDVNFIYAGHGDPARPAHINSQIQYLQDIRHAASQIIKSGNLYAEDGKTLNQKLLQHYASIILKKYPDWGDYGFPGQQLVSGNIAGVILEMVRKS